jgi:hypothetical protein
MPDSVHDGRFIETRNDEPPDFHFPSHAGGISD